MIRFLPYAPFSSKHLQVFVESLDRAFENVCELDLVFQFDEVLLASTLLQRRTDISKGSSHPRRNYPRRVGSRNKCGGNRQLRCVQITPWAQSTSDSPSASTTISQATKGIVCVGQPAVVGPRSGWCRVPRRNFEITAWVVNGKDNRRQSDMILGIENLLDRDFLDERRKG